MRRTVIAAVAMGLVVLGGCDRSAEPAQPPSSEDALTTTSDDSVVTSDPAPTTAEPTEADGPPEMPDEAQEQTEAGAEAFVRHYIALINYTGEHPEVGLLEPLSDETCITCNNYEDNVASLVESNAANDGPAASVKDATAVASGEDVIVIVDLRQNDYKVIDSKGSTVTDYPATPAQLKVSVSPDKPWVITQIQVAATS